MGDDLAAFFAKKAHKKSKKKNVVSLDDVGQQLERKVKIQETGLLETEEPVVKTTTENISKIQQSNEDSEWIECNEKPSVVGIAFKQLTDNPDDGIEKEKKNSSSETTKTWNIINKNEVAAPVEPVLKQQKYQVPSSRRAGPLNLNDKEMFPSIADADGIAEKLKAEEKKRIKNPDVFRPPISLDTYRNNNENTHRFNNNDNINPVNQKNLYRFSRNNENSDPSSGHRSDNFSQNDNSDNTNNDGPYRYKKKIQSKPESNLSKADTSASWRSTLNSASITPKSQPVENTPKKELYKPPFRKHIS